MPFYVADYLGDTGHLSTLEHGAYMLLIMHYWQHQELPTSDSDLAIVARMPVREWMKIRAKLFRFFQEGWRHKRIDAELANTEDKYGKRVAAGRLGGNAKAKRMALEQQEAKRKAGIATSIATTDAGGEQGSEMASEKLSSLYQPQPQPLRGNPSREGTVGLGSISTGHGSTPTDRGCGEPWDGGDDFGGDRDAA